ncbi:MAG TPA: ribonuclease Z [Gemmatimonadales bacterium]|nr:ribonuclease Z [Gemmatimonadales bacterium]HZH42220.1 ribonuclease Z [Gemmatimonadales bacterium]
MLSVTFLGTSAARPTVERNVSSLALQREGETMLFDCGEGTQRQMMRYGVSFALSEIFFTHFHADHFLGLIGLLRTLGLEKRETPVVLYGPKGAKKILSQAISLGVERVPFGIEVVEVKPGDAIGERGKGSREGYEIRAFATEHGGGSVGYLLAEHQRLGRFDPEKARALGIPEGPMWGRLHKGEPVALENGRTIQPSELVGAPRPGRRVAITGDTRPCAAVVDGAAGADLLVHEATFGEEERDRAKETGHSTAKEAAQVALAARARRLVLTHLSARYSISAEELAKEAKEVFPETLVAKDGLTVDVPYVD